MQRLLIRNIKTLVSCDEQDTVYENVDLYAEDGVIRAIGPALKRQAERTGPLPKLLERELLQAMELAARELQDYKTAYECAARQLKL